MSLFYRRLPQFDYIVPETLDEALRALNKYKDASKLLAGGTDLILQLKKRERAAPKYIIDLKGIAGLDDVTYDAAGLKIGPLATITAIAQSQAVQEHYPILVRAALSMASPQIRNRGTFAGNICNAAASADSAPSLLALSASVKIRNSRKERIIPIEQFFTGPGKTVLKTNEIVVEIALPKPLPASRGVYLKLSPRHSMDLAIVGIAAVGTCDNRICKDIKIALGAVSPTPIRAYTTEAILKDREISSRLIDEAAQNAMSECSPRKNSHRASPEYRCDMVYALTKRALNQIFLPQEE
jgi:carbon-monoxide dehydrogenase medium subunit